MRVVVVAPLTAEGGWQPGSYWTGWRSLPHAALATTVVALTSNTPDQSLDLKTATAHLRETGVTVVHLPYDRHLAAGGPIRPESARAKPPPRRHPARRRGDERAVQVDDTAPHPPPRTHHSPPTCTGTCVIEPPPNLLRQGGQRGHRPVADGRRHGLGRDDDGDPQQPVRRARRHRPGLIAVLGAVALFLSQRGKPGGSGAYSASVIWSIWRNCARSSLEPSANGAAQPAAQPSPAGAVRPDPRPGPGLVNGAEPTPTSSTCVSASATCPSRT